MNFVEGEVAAKIPAAAFFIFKEATLFMQKGHVYILKLQPDNIKIKEKKYNLLD